MGPRAAKVVGGLVARVERAAKALTLEIDANLRRSPARGGTPVDTGHARASWVPSVGAPASVEPAGTSQGEHDAGVQAVLRFELGDGALYVVTNAGYVRRLNLGSSDQAPAGFIEACIDQAKAAVASGHGVELDIRTTGAGTFSDDAGGYAADNLASSYSPFGGDDD
jgi:hypothetical protein